MNSPSDIVRDLVRSRLGGSDGMRAKQRVVVAAFVSACSDDNWAPDGAVGLYAGQALEMHMAEGERVFFVCGVLSLRSLPLNAQHFSSR